MAYHQPTCDGWWCMHRHDKLGETPAMFDDGLVGAADQDELRWRMGSDLHEEGWPHNVWCMFRGRMGGAANQRGRPRMTVT